MTDSYTDWHQDFAGSSVWYHVCQGEKIFWLVEPTEENLKSYINWKKNGSENFQFFGDLVNCVRVTLKPDFTLLIPSGWLHAVYTPLKSVVCGGNFLHSSAFEMQLKVYEIEEELLVPLEIRYPLFQRHMWFILARYVFCVTGHDHVRKINRKKKIGKCQLK